MNILPERMCRNEKAYGFDAESAAVCMQYIRE